MIRIALIAIGICAGTAVSQGSATQSTTSRTHVALQTELSNGRTTQSTTYVLESAVGAGVTARRSTSPVYLLEGGFPSTIGVTATGKPWLTSVRPRAAAMRSQATLVLHGTALDLGTTPTVRIGGIPAQLVSRTVDTIATVLPVQPEPGWHPVEVENNLGTTVVPRGVAVLPLIEPQPAPASGKPFDLVFRGSQGDRVLFAIGLAQGRPLVLPGAHFGFAISPPTFIVYSGYSITGNDGELRLPIGGQQYPVGQIYVQALFWSANAGYAPGAFSNVLRL